MLNSVPVDDWTAERAIIASNHKVYGPKLLLPNGDTLKS